MKVVPFANALAVAGGAFYLVCALGVLVVPDLVIAIGDSWAHGIKLSSLPTEVPSVFGVIWGFVTFAAASWFFGYILAWSYNKFQR